MFGAIHWLLLSQSYEHEFEEFGAQYTVLDSCYRVHTSLHQNIKYTHHAERPAFLASHYSIPEPPWATVRSDGTCELSVVRNAFIHEGRYGAEPIGFSHPDSRHNTVLELRAFNTRLILGLIGVDAAYVRSPVNTRQMHGLGLGGVT